MNNRIYINDFCEDLNYQGVILYIGNVNSVNLLRALKRDKVNKTYRLDYALNDPKDSCRNFIYIENCDLQNLDYPVHEYFGDDEDTYDVYVLHEDEVGKFYIEAKLPQMRRLLNDSKR